MILEKLKLIISKLENEQLKKRPGDKEVIQDVFNGFRESVKKVEQDEEIKCKP